jgi:4-hydroxybenzoate polyprenyltransferase
MSTATGREGQTYAGPSLASRYASLVRLPHTLFALPFAGMGVVLASYEHARLVDVATVFWVLVAFTAARFAAMGFNRIADRALDALNPRTRLRELPGGRLTVRQAVVAVAGASALFIGAAWMLNPLCGALAPAALAWVLFYSYTKRFTAWSHVVLGASLGIAPAGAYLAVTGAWTDPWYALPLLSAGVLCWVAGFDVIYALQDESFDRAHGLHSIPARLGAGRALLVARVLHVLSLVAFAALAALRVFPLGPIFIAGLAVMAGLLVCEHVVVHGAAAGPLDLRRIDRAFFRVNIAVSLSLFAFTLIDRLLGGA